MEVLAFHLFLAALFRLVLGLCPTIFKLFINVWRQQGRSSQQFAVTSSLTLTVTTTTGAGISPPGRFTNASTERWSPFSGSAPICFTILRFVATVTLSYTVNFKC